MIRNLMIACIAFAVLADSARSQPPVRPLSDIFLDLDDAPLAQVRRIATQMAALQFKGDKGPLYKSTPKMENRDPNVVTDELIFQGLFRAESKTARLALFSDDGCDVYIDGNRVLSNFKKGQHLPSLDQSLHVLSFIPNPKQTYHIKIHYSNTIFTGATDIDGCTLFAFAGGGLCDDVELKAQSEFIFVNHNDDDRDGVPDYADLHVSGEQNFVPLALTIQPVIDWQNVMVTFHYAGVKKLDLKRFSGNSLGNGFIDYTSAQEGHFRIWSIASPSDQRDAGKYIEPGRAYTAADLGFAGNSEQKTFFLEAVGGASQAKDPDVIRVEVKCIHKLADGKKDQVLQAKKEAEVKVQSTKVNLGVNNSNFFEPAAKRPLRVGIPDVEFHIDEHLEKGKLVKDDHDEKVEDQGDGFVFWWSRDKDLAKITPAGNVDLAPMIIEIPKELEQKKYKFFLRTAPLNQKQTIQAFQVYPAVSPGNNRRQYLQTVAAMNMQIANAKAGVNVGKDQQEVTVKAGVNEFVFRGTRANDPSVTTVVSVLGQGPNDKMAQEVDTVRITFRDAQLFWHFVSIQPQLVAQPIKYPTEDGRTVDLRPFPNPQPVAGFGQRDQARKNHLVMIHGFNVSQAEAAALYSEVNQRLFWLGYRGNFVGLNWPGDLGIRNEITGLPPFDFNVANAFHAAPPVTTFLQTAGGKGWAQSADNLYLMAHSLGNLVSWESLRLHEQSGKPGLVKNLINIQAAVWQEAYDSRGNLKYDKEANKNDIIEYTVDQLQQHSWRFWFNQAQNKQKGDIRRVINGEVYHSFVLSDLALAAMSSNDFVNRGSAQDAGMERRWHYHRNRLERNPKVYRAPVGANNLPEIVPTLLLQGLRTPEYNAGALNLAIGRVSNPIAQRNLDATTVKWRSGNIFRQISAHSDYVDLSLPDIYEWYRVFLAGQGMIPAAIPIGEE